MSVLSELNAPVFAAEGAPADPDPAGWKVKIGGLVEKELILSPDDFKSLDNSTVDCRLTSVSGWSVRADWDGALWRDFIEAHPPLPAATHATFISHGGYRTTVPIATLDHPRALWAWGAGGEALEVDYGGPLRMVVPNLWGYKSCKWVVEVVFTDRMERGYWESRGYSLDGEIEAGVTLDVNTGARRPIKGGEVTEF